MAKSGIVLIVLAVALWPLAIGAALFGFGGLAGDLNWLAKLLSPILLIGGIILVVVGVSRGRPRAVG